jgi:hypothetical protein
MLPAAGRSHTHQMTTGENMTASSEPTSDRPAFFNQLAATVEQLSATRSALRHIIALADNSATLSNEELRNRLAPGCRPCAGR